VQSVCEKAQHLVNQTKDNTLNVYLDSIKTLYEKIVTKSKVKNNSFSSFSFNKSFIIVKFKLSNLSYIIFIGANGILRVFCPKSFGIQSSLSET